MKSPSIATVLAATAAAGATAHPAPTPVEVVADVRGAMPTGITVTPSGRIFINYPQWGDEAPNAIAEVKGGTVVPIADEVFATGPGTGAASRLVSVQSVVADADDRLWILDTGAPKFGEPLAGGPKLVVWDTRSEKVVKTVPLGSDVVLPTTYVNDVRVDLRQGSEGVAYITDSSIKGPGGLIVVDIASGKAMRRLSGHPSTMPDPDFKPMLEGEVLMNRPKGEAPSPWSVATDGIELSADGATLYYCALSSRHFYSVPTALLRDPSASDAQIAAAVRDLGAKAPSDGLAADDRGNIYAGDFEHNAIRRFHDGRWETIASDPRIMWPDTLSVSRDGWLYFTANQLYRQAGFHQGVDLRKQPYHVLRVKIGAGPVLLR